MDGIRLTSREVQGVAKSLTSDRAKRIWDGTTMRASRVVDGPYWVFKPSVLCVTYVVEDLAGMPEYEDFVDLMEAWKTQQTEVVQLTKEEIFHSVWKTGLASWLASTNTAYNPTDWDYKVTREEAEAIVESMENEEIAVLGWEEVRPGLLSIKRKLGL